jgi:ATP adenylyltransferase
VSLDHLWAGWRASYVEASGASGGVRTAPLTATAAEGDCVFCMILASGENDEHRHVVWAGEAMVAMLNAFPYSPGHLLVMPARHVRELEELTGDEGARLWQTVHRGVAALKAAYEPDGLNLGLNLGLAAGAGIPGHLHVHVVPRWLGDTNFMTTAAGVRVLPEALGVTWQRVRAAWV